jgi:hypothetical protein
VKARRSCVLIVTALAACGRVGFAPQMSADGGDGGDGGDPCDPTAALATGLIGWWKLDEGHGVTAVDSAAGNTGLLLGNATWTTGHDGGAAVHFDGLTSHIDVAGTIPYATLDAPFAFSAWFDLEAYTTADPEPDLMQIRSNTASPFHVLLSSSDSYLGLSTGSGDGEWATIKTMQQPSTNAWHHVAMSYNGGGARAIANFQLYVDAAPQPLFAAAGYATQAEQSRIGAAEDVANQWRGAIDDVRLYARALSGSEVKTLFALPCR